MPSGNQAGVYAAALARLDAVARIGSDDARTAVAEMTRKAPRDRLFGDLTVRPDGRAIHPISPFEVQTPAGSEEACDDYAHVDTIQADQAFRPLAEGAARW